MAIRLQCSASATFRISAGGLPSASIVETEIPFAPRPAAIFSRYLRSSCISSDSRSLSWLKFRAPQPSATCSSNSSEPRILASCVICGSMVLSAGLFSSATKIFLNIIESTAKTQRRKPIRFCSLVSLWFGGSFRFDHVVKQFHVEDNDNRGGRPAQNFDPKRIDKFAHFIFVAGKSHQRPDGKAELH